MRFRSQSTALLCLTAVAAAFSSFAVLLPTACAAPPRQQPPAAAPAPSATDESLILLKHTKPQQIIPLLKRSGGKGSPAGLPEGIVSIAPYADKPALRVRGNAEGIDTLRGLVSLLDVEPRRVQLQVRVLRARFGSDGSRQETTITTRTSAVVSNHPLSLPIPPESGRVFSLAITPRLTDDGRVATIAKFGILWEDRINTGFERATTLSTGRTTRVTGLTNAKLQKTSEEIALGRVPARWTGAFVAYYVEIRPDEVKTK